MCLESTGVPWSAPSIAPVPYAFAVLFTPAITPVRPCPLPYGLACNPATLVAVNSSNKGSKFFIK